MNLWDVTTQHTDQIFIQQKFLGFAVVTVAKMIALGSATLTSPA